jgi:hypothetical protein
LAKVTGFAATDKKIATKVRRSLRNNLKKRERHKYLLVIPAKAGIQPFS